MLPNADASLASVKRLLVLAYFFPPIGGAGVQRTVKFARYLPEHGYVPVVVTGAAATGSRWTPADESLAKELPAEVRIARIALPEPMQPSSWEQRQERWLGRPSAWSRWWVQGAEEAMLKHGRGVAAIVATMAPYQSARVAARVARRLDVPWVADLRDPWALDEVLVYPTRLHRVLALRGMRRSLASADLVVMNTPEAAERLRTAFPEFRRKRVEVIPNGYDAEDFGDGPAPRDEDVFRIVHTGYLHTELGRRHRQLGFARRLLGGAAARVDLLTRSHVFLLQAVEQVLAQDAAMPIEVHLAGVQSEADREVSGLYPFVRAHEYVPHVEAVRLMQSADLLFLPLHDLPLRERTTTVPGKTYEYLAARRPILAALPDGDARDIVKAAGNATLCRPADVQCLARGIQEHIGRKQAGRAAPPPRADVLECFERRKQTADLARALDALLTP